MSSIYNLIPLLFKRKIEALKRENLEFRDKREKRENQRNDRKEKEEENARSILRLEGCVCVCVRERERRVDMEVIRRKREINAINEREREIML